MLVVLGGVMSLTIRLIICIVLTYFNISSSTACDSLRESIPIELGDPISDLRVYLEENKGQIKIDTVSARLANIESCFEIRDDDQCDLILRVSKKIIPNQLQLYFNGLNPDTSFNIIGKRIFFYASGLFCQASIGASDHDYLALECGESSDTRTAYTVFAVRFNSADFRTLRRP